MGLSPISPPLNALMSKVLTCHNRTVIFGKLSHYWSYDLFVFHKLPKKFEDFDENIFFC